MTNAGSNWTPQRRILQATNLYAKQTALYEEQVTRAYVAARLAGPEVWEATLAYGPWSRQRATRAIQRFNAQSGNRYRWTVIDRQRTARQRREAARSTLLPTATLLRYM
jgi:hypothetical protein